MPPIPTVRNSLRLLPGQWLGVPLCAFFLSAWADVAPLWLPLGSSPLGFMLLLLGVSVLSLPVLGFIAVVMLSGAFSSAGGRLELPGPVRCFQVAGQMIPSVAVPAAYATLVLGFAVWRGADVGNASLWIARCFPALVLACFFGSGGLSGNVKGAVQAGLGVHPVIARRVASWWAEGNHRPSDSIAVTGAFVVLAVPTVYMLFRSPDLLLVACALGSVLVALRAALLMESARPLLSSISVGGST